MAVSAATVTTSLAGYLAVVPAELLTAARKAARQCPVRALLRLRPT